MYETRRSERELTERNKGRNVRRKQAKAEQQRIPALELLMLLLGAVLVAFLVFVVCDGTTAELSQTVKIIWWSVIALIVTGLASWGM